MGVQHPVGVSYSGGGPLLLVELGVAQAFVNLGIVPTAIAGVSAGSIAGCAHALDPIGGTGIKAAARALSAVNDGTLKLRPSQIVWDALSERQHLAGIGDNEPLKPILQQVFIELGVGAGVTFGDLQPPKRSPLIVGATDRISGEALWFSATDQIADALIASSAIPGVFPAKRITINNQQRWFVDGGVVSNQPLWVLVEAGCQTIYSCAVGYDGGRLKAPTSLVDNAMQSISILIHNATCLEEAFVRKALAGLVVHHIHPEISFPVMGFNFNQDVVDHVIDEACQKTMNWIETNALKPGDAGESRCVSTFLPPQAQQVSSVNA